MGYALLPPQTEHRCAAWVRRAHQNAQLTGRGRPGRPGSPTGLPAFRRPDKSEATGKPKGFGVAATSRSARVNLLPRFAPPHIHPSGPAASRRRAYGPLALPPITRDRSAGNRVSKIKFHIHHLRSSAEVQMVSLQANLKRSSRCWHLN